MISFDQLRSALLATNPHGSLDRLIRAELSTGRTTAVYDELVGHLDTIRAMQEYTDELEDLLGDKLDGLSGWWRPDRVYQDSSKVDQVVSVLSTCSQVISHDPNWGDHF
jgi:hypothetical protein